MKWKSELKKKQTDSEHNWTLVHIQPEGIQRNSIIVASEHQGCQGTPGGPRPQLAVHEPGGARSRDKDRAVCVTRQGPGVDPGGGSVYVGVESDSHHLTPSIT